MALTWAVLYGSRAWRWRRPLLILVYNPCMSSFWFAGAHMPDARTTEPQLGALARRAARLEGRSRARSTSRNAVQLLMVEHGGRRATPVRSSRGRQRRRVRAGTAASTRAGHSTAQARGRGLCASRRTVIAHARALSPAYVERRAARVYETSHDSSGVAPDPLAERPLALITSPPSKNHHWQKGHQAQTSPAREDKAACLAIAQVASRAERATRKRASTRARARFSLTRAIGPRSHYAYPRRGRARRSDLNLSAERTEEELQAIVDMGEGIGIQEFDGFLDGE